MTDTLSADRRSANMARIRGKDTKPELFVRRALHALGYRFRLHGSGLPGNPDLVFSSRRAVIFVHGCFWHRHTCGKAYVPKTRTAFWQAKFLRNTERDAAAEAALRSAGWRVIVVWECELVTDSDVLRRLAKLLGPTGCSGRSHSRTDLRRSSRKQKTRAEAKKRGSRPLRGR
jgi:DNA mismatch endonuclease Vsr